MNIKQTFNKSRDSFRKPLPIPFGKLEAGSMFRIFAELSRGIAKSSDPTVYQKMAESHSEDTSNREHAIILYPEDRVIPLTRPSNKRK